MSKKQELVDNIGRRKWDLTKYAPKEEGEDEPYDKIYDAQYSGSSTMLTFVGFFATAWGIIADLRFLRIYIHLKLCLHTRNRQKDNSSSSSGAAPAQEIWSRSP